MFDTHCHLNSYYDNSTSFPQSDNSYLAVSTQLNDWAPTLDFAVKHNGIYPALGIHPWFVNDSYHVDLLVLKSLLLKSKIAALGEIGLDFKDEFKNTKLIQLDCFEAQLQLAQHHNLPVSLHCIKAHNDMLSLLKSYNVTGVIHGLGSSVQIAQQYVDLGFKFGVNGVTVRDNANRYHELVRTFGLKHIVLETDYPNINLPGLVNCQLSDINNVAQKVSTLLNISIEDVIKQTDYNSFQLFNKN
ncbi:TatD family hydrolase [Thiomicrorhabdus hydrogeniphila]